MCAINAVIIAAHHDNDNADQNNNNRNGAGSLKNALSSAGARALKFLARTCRIQLVTPPDNIFDLYFTDKMRVKNSSNAFSIIW